MELEQVLEWQAEFKSRYLQNDKKLLDAYEAMLTGKELPSGTANAVAKSLELRLKSSPDEIRALLVPRADVTIETKETVDLNINITADKVKSLTPEQVAEWVRTSVLPSVMTEIEDVEYEDITGDDDDNE